MSATKLRSLSVIIALLFLVAGLSWAIRPSLANSDGQIAGVRVPVLSGEQETVAQIMERERVRGPQTAPVHRLVPGTRGFPPEVLTGKPELEGPGSKGLAGDPNFAGLSQWPPAPTDGQAAVPLAPQTLGTSFDGVTGPTETGAFPPDTMGAVGPTQFFVFVNGRLRTFNKTTGVADGVMNADPDVFFAAQLSPPPSTVPTFTSDPRVRYDRLSGRWFLVIIDVPCANATCTTLGPNRILIAVSDAASAGVITAGTVWTKYFLQVSTVFLDYPTLGIDNLALYVGGNMYTTASAFTRTDGFVIRKAEILAGTPPVAFQFTGMVATSTGAGPFTPQGVDNYDPASTQGYFIGVDNATFNTLMVRRVSTPGGTPTMSANISIAVPTTRFPVLVPHLGNTGGLNGRLDALDDRLFAAHMRNGRLWTAHNIGVNNTGVAGATNNRNAARWYELQNLSGTPSLVQSGTVFEPGTANDANQPNIWIPSIMVSGQGHAAMGYSRAGTNERVNAWTVGRLVGDTLGTMQTPISYTNSTFAYNPPGDPGGTAGRRWGDYSYTSLDPLDDMTMWTIQEWVNGTNTYGTRAVQLIAPPPAMPSQANPAFVPLNNPSINVVITGTSSSGSGFYDPGANLAPPALPFKHITATIPGVIVNSATYNNPTRVTLNISTVGSLPGPKNVTITNPDGQSRTGIALITVGPTAANMELVAATRAGDGTGTLVEWRTAYEVDNLGFNVYREEGGKRTRLNPSLIAGSALKAGGGASPAGATYAWWDATRASSNAKYLIEAVDLAGTSSWHGPVSPTDAAGRAIAKESRVTLLSEIGQSKAGSRPVERAAAMPQSAAGPANLAGGAAVKLGVREEGWYRVGQADLLAAGLDGNVDPRLLQMYVDGQQIAIQVSGEADGRLDPQDAVEFYGMGLDVQSTNTRVYWLAAGSQAGLRLQSVGSGAKPAASGSFPYTVERKESTIYFPAVRNGDTENFYGAAVRPEGVDQTLTVRNKVANTGMGVIGQEATLEVALQGVTLVPHQVRVSLNGREVGTVAFDGQGAGVVSLSVSSDALVEGDNVVRLAGLAGQNDISLVDYIRLTYPHSYTADSDALRMTTAGAKTVSVSGFSRPDIRLVDITDASRVREVAGAVSSNGNNHTIAASDGSVGSRTLLAFTGGQVKQVASISANRLSSLQGTGHAADLVIIAHRDLVSSVAPLKALRESQGLAVEVVDVEDIYDEFSYGAENPAALKQFLGYARNNWTRAPRYVLLVGDASYDPKNYLGIGDSDMVATKLVDTDNMETASDDWFADFAGNGLAQMAIGRLPVTTSAQASAMVSKIVGYEQASPSGSALLVSDQDAGGYFEDASAQVGQLVPAGVQVTHIRRSEGTIEQVRARLLQNLNSGQKLVNYIGHGSLDHWAGNMLTSADAANLTNQDHLSAFIDMTCLNGYFQEPAADSLSEALMKGQGGAVAVWSSSGMALADGQVAMNQELYRALFGSESLTLGEATLRAKASVADRTVRDTWILFGDPSGKLR